MQKNSNFENDLPTKCNNDGKESTKVTSPMHVMMQDEYPDDHSLTVNMRN
jgi:hypothetical protein